MRAGLRAVLAFAALLLAGCMTPYQPAGFGGGYQEQKLAGDTYLVSFYGNGNTPNGVVAQYFLYRCAELTSESGYAYFELFAPAREQAMSEGSPFVKTAHHSPPPSYTYVPRGTVMLWTYRAVVRMYPKDILLGAPTLFSAREVLDALGPEVRAGNPSPHVPERFRRVLGKFPVMPLPSKETSALPPKEAPARAGPVNLDDLKGLMPQE